MSARLTGPRIGRPDVRAALAAGRGRLDLDGTPVLTPRVVPPSDEVAERARAIADSLAQLTRLCRSVRRGFAREDRARRARVDALQDRAVEAWHELARLATEASESREERSR